VGAAAAIYALAGVRIGTNSRAGTPAWGALTKQFLMLATLGTGDFQRQRSHDIDGGNPRATVTKTLPRIESYCYIEPVLRPTAVPKGYPSRLALRFLLEAR
jgi:hypothetical protein